MLAVSSSPSSVLPAWWHQLQLERLHHRAALIRECLAGNNQDWEGTTWIWIARSMGQPVNTAAFGEIARSVPVRLLFRYRLQRSVAVALLLGQAGLLEEPSDMQREYRYLKTKHGLISPCVRLSFLRMRPGHFPSSRLDQLAGLMATGWFAFLRETPSAKEVLRRLQGHPGLGVEMRRGLLINAFVPLLFAYGWLRDEPDVWKKALRWLQELGPERNAVLSRWRRLGMTDRNAGDSQALLQLKKEYCDARRCLDCAIGKALISAPGQLPQSSS
jgi:hypothetical protein